MIDLGGAPLDKALIAQRIRPLFSRALAPGSPIYLANHSLGRPPDRAAEDVAQAMQAWSRDMGEAWRPWLDAREKFRAMTARLVGASTPDSIVPKTSAAQGLRAVLNACDERIRVVTTDAEFDSLDFVLRVYRERGRIDLTMVPPRAEALIAALAPRCDLVVLSTVLFRSGEIVAGVDEVIRRAHATGAKVLLDVYHHAGVLPLDLVALNADFAVGGSYKYTRGGPGACWLYVHPRHQGLRTLDTGWFAKEAPFAYARPDPPRFAPGGDAWLESTPPVLAAVQALAGLEFTLDIGVERLRIFHLAQKQRFAALLANHGLRVEGAGTDYGAFLTFVHPRASELATRLKERGVKTDARGEYLRLCADLLNTDDELAAAADALQALV
ncbi:MAG: aminotransferase class V-fold PLP-dependent enzyme [Betaproteobacteria bacterium]|nr:MAG: aminotransferase class V-fold PLP-dependent enzyme [Betaproteobacteria bacterium]